MLVLAAASLSACVTAPYNDELVDRGAVDFGGYARNASAVIVIQAKDKQTNGWVTIDVATAASVGTNYGGETLYGWSALDTDTTTTGGCIWGDPASPGCSIGAGGQGTFRVLEQGHGQLTTFEDGGVECVVAQVESGTNWFTAGVNCSSAESPDLTLHTMN